MLFDLISSTASAVVLKRLATMKKKTNMLIIKSVMHITSVSVVHPVKVTDVVPLRTGLRFGE